MEVEQGHGRSLSHVAPVDGRVPQGLLLRVAAWGVERRDLFGAVHAAIHVVVALQGVAVHDAEAAVDGCSPRTALGGQAGTRIVNASNKGIGIGV